MLPLIPRKRLNRRDWLRAGGLACMASGLPVWLGIPTERAMAEPIRGNGPAGKIRSCILLFSYGGPSQFETYDPKPQAAAEVRGEYKPIETAVPGILVGEYLPRVARIMDKLALVRSVHHPMRNHNSAAAEILTGRTPTGGDLELLADESRSFPTLGSAVGYALGARAHVLPYVALPYTIYNVVQLPGQIPGILGGAYDRFQVQGNPGADNFRVNALEFPAGRSANDLQARARLLRDLDGSSPGGGPAKMRTYQDRALQLVASDEVRKGFEMSRERPETRDRYGRTLVGQSLLLARRLVESGVNFVTVYDGQHNGQDANWDSHQTIFPRHRQLIPPHDQAFSALIEDLAERGLLDSTLVIATAEFGRTPKINGNAGRDHWPDCFTVVMAGGGVRGGTVYGASDAIGAYPARDPVTPGDLTATIFRRFGIDPAHEFHDPAGRPWRLSDGQALDSLFG